MAVTLKQTEIPESYPSITALALSAAAAALDPKIVWSRIESYVATRWSERDVIWIAEGPGEWVPPLSPAIIATAQVWSGAAEWETIELSASPLGGYFLPARGPYRFTGFAGDDETPPPTVMEAFRRLAEYLATPRGKVGVTSESITAGSISIAYRRDPTWQAQAMENSGAGDLLRPFRRAA